MAAGNDKLVFVSYAHEDRAFLDREVMPYLRQLELGEQIELWHDRLIGVGEDCYGEIADKLDHAKVAILLVTQNFLASRFCLHEETPVLLQRARRGELHLLPLLVEPWAEDGWRGADRSFAWSFYSQGTGRMTDAETFLNEALKWFGAKDWEGKSLWDRAELLAERIRQRRTLLILDGVEPLQSGEDGVDRGSLRDSGLRTLLEELAKGHPGLCVVTTREQLADLEAAVADLGDHALAVSLLGNLLKDGNPSPHVSGAKTLPPLTHPVEQRGHPRRVLDAWVQRLGDGAELELLHIVGLFDRPAALDAIQAVIDGDPLPGLNEHLGEADLDAVLVRLRTARLLARASTHEKTLDTHPIVREHFGARLKSQHPKSWTEGHRRLYQHFKDTTEHQPDDLAGMQPLFAAVVHGCAAGRHQEARAEVYFGRINRGREFYLTRKLGAFAADLSCLSHFFEERWRRPWPGLSSVEQRWLPNVAGFLLRGLGRLREAVGPLAEGLRLDVAAEDWQNASISAGNLSELHLAIGELPPAEARAREAVAHADASGDTFQRMVLRTAQADALHQLGRIVEAQALFAEAERMQVERQPTIPFLTSLQGFLYCDLLLAEGEPGDVLRRAAKSLDWTTAQGWLLDIALDHLSLGRANLAASPPDLTAAEPHLQAAVDGLRASGNTDDIPRGLLARAAFHRMRDDLPSAEKDLDTVVTLVRRHGLRLFEADLALERTRCHLARGDAGSARETLEVARELITSMSYGRRRAELEALDGELNEM